MTKPHQVAYYSDSKINSISWKLLKLKPVLNLVNLIGRIAQYSLCEPCLLIGMYAVHDTRIIRSYWLNLTDILLCRVCGVGVRLKLYSVSLWKTVRCVGRYFCRLQHSNVWVIAVWIGGGRSENNEGTYITPFIRKTSKHQIIRNHRRMSSSGTCFGRNYLWSLMNSNFFTYFYGIYDPEQNSRAVINAAVHWSTVITFVMLYSYCSNKEMNIDPKILCAKYNVRKSLNRILCSLQSALRNHEKAILATSLRY